jgi:hypothetical protein
VNSSSEKYILSFLTNDDFIEYVVHPTNQLVEKWSNFFKRNPSLNIYAQKARIIISGELQIDENLTEQELLELKKQIITNCNISTSN